jgi:uncharacterized protein YgiM (DUF1202 family)
MTLEGYRGWLLWLAGLLLLSRCLPLQAADSGYYQVRVTGPYLELHTGPGRAYPVFYVVDRGELVDVVKRRTDWFLVRATHGKQGWVRRADMEKTESPQGEPTHFAEASLGDYSRRKWETGVMAGDFEGANILTAYTGYYLNSLLSAEVQLSQVFGNYSDALSASINLLSQPFPEWRLSPYFLVGTGVIRVSPNVTLTNGPARNEQIANVGVGVRWYLTRRFLVRAEYENHVIFQNTNDNQEINEWKAGFAFFF